MGSYSKVSRSTEVFNNVVGAMLSSRIEKETNYSEEKLN
jgi:hypothetical protein